MVGQSLRVSERADLVVCGAGGTRTHDLTDYEGSRSTCLELSPATTATIHDAESSSASLDGSVSCHEPCHVRSSRGTYDERVHRARVSHTGPQRGPTRQRNDLLIRSWDADTHMSGDHAHPWTKRCRIGRHRHVSIAVRGPVGGPRSTARPRTPASDHCLHGGDVPRTPLCQSRTTWPTDNHNLPPVELVVDRSVNTSWRDAPRIAPVPSLASWRHAG